MLCKLSLWTPSLHCWKKMAHVLHNVTKVQVIMWRKSSGVWLCWKHGSLTAGTPTQSRSWVRIIIIIGTIKFIFIIIQSLPSIDAQMHHCIIQCSCQNNISGSLVEMGTGYMVGWRLDTVWTGSIIIFVIFNIYADIKGNTCKSNIC